MYSGTKPGISKAFSTPGFFRLRANVVPVIESDRARLLQREHRLDVHRHRPHRSLDVFVRIFRAQRDRFRERHSVRHIAVERIVRAGLIGQNIGNDAASHHFRQDIRAIADQPDRKRCRSLRACSISSQRFIERCARSCRNSRSAIASRSARDRLRSPRKTRAVHRRGERLRAAHAAQPAGDNKFSLERSAEMSFGRGGESFESSLHDSLAADVDPRAGRHLAVHR